MQVKYTLTQRDILDGMNANYQRSRLLWLGAWAALMYGVGGFFMRLLFQNSLVVWKVTSLYPFGLFYGCAFLWILPWWAARLLFSKRPSIQEPQTLTVDATGAHWHWDSGSSVLAWKSFIRWHEGKNGFVLYTSPATFNIVPKRAFSEDELKDFRGLLSREISSQKR
jgi:YcxB-like protein